MPMYIDADSYIKYCEENWIPLNVDAVLAQKKITDVRENVHAKWLPYKFGTKRWHKCSACGIADEYINEKGLEARREFCPHCGARMEESDAEIH